MHTFQGVFATFNLQPHHAGFFYDVNIRGWSHKTGRNPFWRDCNAWRFVSQQCQAHFQWCWLANLTLAELISRYKGKHVQPWWTCSHGEPAASHAPCNVKMLSYLRSVGHEQGFAHLLSFLWNCMVQTEAQKGDFFSYAAGTAYQMLRRYGGRVHGLMIHNYRSTLPMAKGLSSSAAICVLVRSISWCVCTLSCVVWHLLLS